MNTKHPLVFILMNSTEGLVFILMNSTEGLVFMCIHHEYYCILREPWPLHTSHLTAARSAAPRAGGHANGCEIAVKWV